jgi:hypothetical protein
MGKITWIMCALFLRILAFLWLIGLFISSKSTVYGQSVLYEYWLNIRGASVSDLTEHERFPNDPDGASYPLSFEAPVNWNDHYGARMRAYITPTLTGDYRFFISGDNQSELWLSSDASPGKKVLIAHVPQWTSSRQWDKYPEQSSDLIHLKGGQRYYVEALQKEESGGDNLAVGWFLPNGRYQRPISGTYLQPYEIVQGPPSIIAQPKDAFAFEGERALFELIAQGREPISFQWYRNDVAIEGAIFSSFFIESASIIDNNVKYHCVVSNNEGEVFSEAAQLFVSSEQIAPQIAKIKPPHEITLRRLSEIEIIFSEPVLGVDATDLLINQQAAESVTGFGAGPYHFHFAEARPGDVVISWADDHGITDLAGIPNKFVGYAWQYNLDPSLEIPKILINEFVAVNGSDLKDKDGERHDWIELYNPNTFAVSIAGWSLSDNIDEPDKWTFPNISIAAQSYLCLFASAKDLRTVSTRTKLHTNFKLNPQGEYLGLFNQELPPTIVDEINPQYPMQRVDISYGRNSAGAWRYFDRPTPGSDNLGGHIIGMVDPPHFSVERGFYESPFKLSLEPRTAGSYIRYTLNGSEPTLRNGMDYVQPISLGRTAIVRATAFKENYLPSKPETHSYFFRFSRATSSLPVISLATDQRNLTGRSGIMETNPRNTTKRGLAWERPVSAELILPKHSGGFQVDCGLRIQGGNYVRERYDPNSNLPFSKYSFRLYFRSDYGPGRLEYPIFPNCPVMEFDKIVLRAGMNDHSNPFIVDEFVRRLSADMGLVASHGAFVNLYLNGVYQGYYNPTERIDQEFLQSWHGGDNDWDLIAQFGEISEGDDRKWRALRTLISRGNFSLQAKYEQLERHLDLSNFVDYLLLNILGATGDWPHNNWRAACERTPEAIWRFYVWDAEWAFGVHSQVNRNTFQNELNGNSDIARFYQRLKQSSEFRLLFADRIQKHFYNNGALTKSNLLRRFNSMKNEMAEAIPNLRNDIPRIWIPQRTRVIMTDLRQEGLISPIPSPRFNQHGGPAPRGFPLEINVTRGTAYYTFDGADPRIRFSSEPSPSAQEYIPGQALPLTHDTLIRARIRDGDVWSALEEAHFQIGSLGTPLRITEIMYHSPEGAAGDFIELHNTSSVAQNLSGMRLTGINFMFPHEFIIEGNDTILLISDSKPTDFSLLYPDASVAGTFSGALSNRGESIKLLSPAGQTLLSVSYEDRDGWPDQTDGAGYSLELIDFDASSNDPANWRKSIIKGGTPGQILPAAPTAAVRINEIMANNQNAVANGSHYPDWIELRNNTSSKINLGSWVIKDSNPNNSFTFPTNTSIPANGYLIIWFDQEYNDPGLHTGFGLDREYESIFLYDAKGVRIDAVSLGSQVPDYSVGLISNDQESWSLTIATPGGFNLPAEIAPQSNLALNEWLSNPKENEFAWIELHNKNQQMPISLHGVYITVDNSLQRIDEYAYIEGGGYLQLLFNAENKPLDLHLELPTNGATIQLFSSDEAEIDNVKYAPQDKGVSGGRWPDGGEGIHSFKHATTPGRSNSPPNYLGPKFNEIMAANLSNFINEPASACDWIELVNPLDVSYDLTNMSISVGAPRPGAWSFPNGFHLEPRGHILIMCNPQKPASIHMHTGLNIGNALNDQGDTCYLFDKIGRIVDVVEFGNQVKDQTIGLDNGIWTLLETPSPGAKNSDAAKLGSLTDVLINEWMAAPAAGPDWFELHNKSELPAALTGTYLTDTPSLAGKFKYQIGPLCYIGAKAWFRWYADSTAHHGPDHVNFSLDRLGEVIQLNQDTGHKNHSINFGPQALDISEGLFPDGGDTIYKFPGSPTPGAANILYLDSDNDGLPDFWEAKHGLNPQDLSDAHLDYDADGMSNLDEYLVDTVPTDPTSVLRLEISETSDTSIVFEFYAVKNVHYTIFFQDNLLGEWQEYTQYFSANKSGPVTISEILQDSIPTRYYRLAADRTN